MKKILTIIIVLLSVFLIYLGFKDEKIYYLSIGDFLANGVNSYGAKDYGYADYVKEYLEKNEMLEVYVNSVENNKRSIDVIRDINDNVDISVGNKIKTFQNALIKADLVTISLGTNDFLNNLEFSEDFSVNDLYNKLEQASKDFEELFKVLRKYCKEKIVFIGFYNTKSDPNLNEFFEYANKKIMKIASSYNIDYINIYEEFKDNKYFDNITNSLPNKQGYKLISDKIIELIALDK